MSVGISGKVVLITGGGTGLCVETAKYLVLKRARVAVAARRKEKLDEFVAIIVGGGGETRAYTLDVVDKKRDFTPINSPRVLALSSLS
jgi:NADP-dependent 3-hydroxy acid dehydrogenase YdfG